MGVHVESLFTPPERSLGMASFNYIWHIIAIYAATSWSHTAAEQNVATFITLLFLKLNFEEHFTDISSVDNSLFLPLK